MSTWRNYWPRPLVNRWYSKSFTKILTTPTSYSSGKCVWWYAAFISSAQSLTLPQRLHMSLLCNFVISRFHIMYLQRVLSTRLLSQQSLMQYSYYKNSYTAHPLRWNDNAASGAILPLLSTKSPNRRIKMIFITLPPILLIPVPHHVSAMTINYNVTFTATNILQYCRLNRTKTIVSHTYSRKFTCDDCNLKNMRGRSYFVIRILWNTKTRASELWTGAAQDYEKSALPRVFFCALVHSSAMMYNVNIHCGCIE